MPLASKEISAKPALFSIAECSVILGRSRQTTSRIFEKEPGVIVIERPEGPNKRGYRSITVPRSVLTRVLGRLSKGGAIAVHYAKHARS